MLYALSYHVWFLSSVSPSCTVGRSRDVNAAEYQYVDCAWHLCSWYWAAPLSCLSLHTGSSLHQQPPLRKGVYTSVYTAPVGRGVDGIDAMA
jgi:hypothetical protein